MADDFYTYDFKTDTYSKGMSNSGFTPGYMEVGNNMSDKQKDSSTFLSRFKSNMGDYFKDNPNAFDFTGGDTKPGDISIGSKVDAFTSQIFPNFVKDYGPQKAPITIQGQQGSPGLLSQIAGPVAGAAASALFPCDMRLKHDVDCLTDMNLVKDDLADVAYFVKELQDS